MMRQVALAKPLGIEPGAAASTRAAQLQYRKPTVSRRDTVAPIMERTQ
jgi:hypothetical protein